MLVTFNDERLPLRFWARVSKGGRLGCWSWTGSATTKGYGQIQWKTDAGWRRISVHRLVVMASGISIPDGHEIDHECENKVCVNPGHLNVVTPTRNIELYRERHPYVQCKNGHTVGDSGVYVSAGTQRCRICTKDAQRKYRQRKREGKPRSERVTYCKRGHVRTPENVVGSRNCRLCENARNQHAYHRRRKDVTQP